MTMKRALRRILISAGVLACLPGCFGAAANKQAKREKNKQADETKRRRDMANRLDNTQDDAFSVIEMSSSVDRDIANLERKLRDAERRQYEARSRMSEARELLLEEEMRVKEIQADLAQYHRVKDGLRRDDFRGGADARRDRDFSRSYDEAAFNDTFPNMSRQPPSTTGAAWKSADSDTRFTPDINMSTPIPPSTGGSSRSGVPMPTSMAPPPSANTYRLP